MSFNCLITTLGQAKIAAAIASGTPVNATHIAVGDGNGNDTAPSVSQLALVREVHRVNVSSITVNPADSSQVIFEAVIPANVGGWTARELGLFDSTGSLIAVANIGSVYKPTAIEGSAREMVVRIYAQVNQVGAINLVVDPSFFIATRSWVQSNFSLAALIPGGTTGQILRKKSNTSGDTEWANPLSAQNITVDVVTEIQTLASGQTVVTLATANTSGTAIYVEGIRLRPNQYTVNSTTQFTLAQSYPANSKLLAVQNDPNASLDFAKKSLNLSDLASASSARTNLGLGTIATAAAADYLTVAAGLAKAGGTMTGPLVLSPNSGSLSKSGTPLYGLYAIEKTPIDYAIWRSDQDPRYVYSANWWLTTGKTIFNQTFTVPSGEVWEVIIDAPFYYDTDDGFNYAWVTNGTTSDTQTASLVSPTRYTFVPNTYTRILTTTTSIALKVAVFTGSNWDAISVSTASPGSVIIRKYKI